jgi:hypothetical protein
MGKEKGAWVYTGVTMLTGISIFILWLIYRPADWALLAAVAPGIILSFALAWLVSVKKLWRSNKTIEPVCGLTIVLNHICSITIAILVRW